LNKEESFFMGQSDLQRKKLLITDDSEINRAILADILGEEFGIYEASDGVEAVAMLEEHSADISAVLLDISMPRMNGFEVLAVMNQRHWIEDIPVLVISAESGASQIEHAFDLGATDFIMRPFDALLVYRRVVNTVLLYTKQKQLLNLLVEQIDEKERRSHMMVDILSHIVEFRNGESGQHIIHVRTFTEVVLRQLQRITDRYVLTQAEISMIGTASSLHDIGKIVIDEKILNKPGRLTPEEFEQMKQHTVAGANMLERVPAYQDALLMRTSWEICRWHHERYDGRGYPDGLVGDEIPISAQVVALADVYDALISERCYKKSYSHDEAIRMILNGECGVFNPLLMECLKAVEKTLSSEFLRVKAQEESISRRGLINEILTSQRLYASDRSLKLMEQERMKSNFFSAMTNEIQFEYNGLNDTLRLSPWAAERMGLEEVICHPTKNPVLMNALGAHNFQQLQSLQEASSPEQPLITLDCLLPVDGVLRWHRVVAQMLWSDEGRAITGMLGRITDIHDSRVQLSRMERKATHDGATGILNLAGAKEQVGKRLQDNPEGHFVMAVFDLDHLKQINDTYGHLAGSKVLKALADKARQSVRGNDIVARIGGDEFLLFLEYTTDIDKVILRIFNTLPGCYEGIPVTVSMGVAKTADVDGAYEALFHAADKALYCAKRGGRNRCVFYDDSMREILSQVPNTAEDSNKGDAQ